ncbi:MAG: hypothetical protein EA384_01190, partial [Spirochaetaceae bacterium]
IEAYLKFLDVHEEYLSSLSRIAGDEGGDQLPRLLEQLERSLQLDGNITIDLGDGELVVRIADVTVLDQVFVSDDEGPFIRAQWRDKTRRLSGQKRANPRGFLDELCALVSTDNEEMRSQVVQADQRIREIDAAVTDVNQRLEQVVARLYGLDDDLYRVVSR